MFTVFNLKATSGKSENYIKICAIMQTNMMT
jgi:hypothetical protein